MSVQSLSTEELIGIVSTAVAVAIAIVSPVRRIATRTVVWTIANSGYANWRYRRWFLREHSYIYNLYLDEKEQLGIAETFVPLTLAVLSRSAQARGQEGLRNLVATDVMSDRDSRTLIVLGDAGAGKSTLLKAYGVGVLSRTRRARLLSAAPEIPVLIPLRLFARGDANPGQLEDYIKGQVFAKSAGLGRLASTYFGRLIRRKRLLLLLDGIDEVSNAKYGWVRDSIHLFKDMYGSQVRIVVTCRQQNFRSRRGDWITSFADRAFVLSEFRDEDIHTYVLRRASSFVAPHTPAGFISAVYEAGLADLHRVPLVLAMSVGLYASRPDFDIPPTVSLLYEAMVEDLLQRRDNRLNPEGNSNSFVPDDKRVFLSKFAFETAAAAGKFEDFQRAAVVLAARRDAPSLTAVPDSAIDGFVDEIVNRSGMIVVVTDDGDLTFAHRSVYEYMAASYLRRSGLDSAAFLLERAADPQWRQPILFYTSMAPGDLGNFLLNLIDVNLDLAGYCLGVAPSGGAIADDVINQLVTAALRDPGLFLPALLYAARSPNPRIRTLATKGFQDVVVSLGKAGGGSGDFGGDIEGLLRVLSSVAASGSPEIVSAAAPLLGGFLPDSDSLVEQLWRCVTVTVNNISRWQGARYVITRLLSMATDAERFATLQTMPTLTDSSLPAELRRRCYPFRFGQDVASNLVTLITIGDQFDPPVEVANRFYECKKTKHFKTVERSKRRTVTIPSAIIVVPVQLLVLAIGIGLAIAGPGFGFTQVYSRGSIGDGLQAMRKVSGLGVVSYGLIAFAVILVMVLTFMLIAVIGVENDGIIVLSLIVAPALSLLVVPLAMRSILVYFLGAVLAPVVVAVAAVIAVYAVSVAWGMREAYRPIYVPPLNPFLNLYDDPKSRHWVTRAA